MMIESRRVPWAPDKSAIRGQATAIYAMLFVLGVAAGVAAGGGMDKTDFSVKATLAALIALVGMTLMAWRPVIFPLVLYVLAIPFDIFLQTGGGTITKMLGAATGGLLLVVLIDPRRRLSPPLAVFAWTALIAWEFTSLLWSLDAMNPIVVLSTSIQFALFAIVAMMRIRAGELYAFVAAVIAGGTAMASYSLYLFVHGSNIFKLGGEQRLVIKVGANASLDPNHLAGSLVVPITLALVVAMRNRGWVRWLTVAALVTMLGCVYATAARGPMIALAVVWLYLMLFDKGDRVKLAALGVAALLCTIPFPSVWLRFLNDNVANADGRTGIWGLAWIAFKNHWLFGVGSGQFKAAYAEAYLQSALGPGAHPWYEDSHNLIVNTSVELGVIGLCVMAAAWFFQFRMTRFIRSASPFFAMRTGIEGATLGLLVLAMSLDLMIFKYLWLGFTAAAMIRSAALSEPRREAA